MKQLDFLAEREAFNRGVGLVVGCDEVGRGALAGPVVAAAVAWSRDADWLSECPDLRGVADSKVLSARTRELLTVCIKRYALAFGVASVSARVVDKINIHEASLLAMARAVKKLHVQLNAPEKNTLVFVDGKFVLKDFRGDQQAVVGGDANIFSIAAASVIAKVWRDRYMVQLGSMFPGYGFEVHKGYGTPAHIAQVKALGLCDQHRKTFCSRLTR
jgi:ribonuclease HII